MYTHQQWLTVVLLDKNPSNHTIEIKMNNNSNHCDLEQIIVDVIVYKSSV